MAYTRGMPDRGVTRTRAHSMKLIQVEHFQAVDTPFGGFAFVDFLTIGVHKGAKASR